MSQVKQYPIDKVVKPIQKFIQHEKSGGLVLGISVLIALILANTPLAHSYHHFFEHSLAIHFDGKPYFDYSLHHWINDGLMAIFFFVVGLELKREIVAGELANPKKALLPIAAALGGMIVPAAVYALFNFNTDTSHGWGIPMATDIAFALGVLYLLGNKIPLGLKVFLTALAIVDDLGAVLVIAFFYTSDISFTNLMLGILCLAAMFIGNKMGIRSLLFYGILGIGGVWTCFLLSGVHATIAAVLAAFTIPANVKINEVFYVERIKQKLIAFKNIDPNDDVPTLSNNQLHILDDIKKRTNQAIPPLQILEHAMHPFVTFVILPIFAIANAGVTFIDINPETLFNTHVAIGVALGLLIGKPLGVVGFTLLCVKLKIAHFPTGMTTRRLIGLGFLASIGFTMSLFITSLAFHEPLHMTQAKIGIFAASLIGGVLGYIILNKQSKQAMDA